MRPRYSRADRAPTWTSRTTGALGHADAPLSFRELLVLTGATPDQLRAALHHLINRAGAVLVIPEGDVPFYMLSGEDRRTLVVEQRVQEPRGNRARRHRAAAEGARYGR
jgi:hypothetical protein